MSLSDSIFIFVLALIIFGPKKLPAMAKQLGRLVGEFRRASNEFKFQIEDELRQAENQDRLKVPSAEPTILPPTPLPSSSDTTSTDSTEIVSLPAIPNILPAVGAEPRTTQPHETAPIEAVEVTSHRD